MKDKKILFGTFIALLLLLTTGLSYAYFSTSVSGNDNAKDVVVETGTLKLVYTDSLEIVANNIKPGWTTTKEVSVKNTGTLDTAYNLVWQELTNEITNNELVISASCERLNSSNAVEGTCESITESSVGSNKIKKNISIESGITHKYTFTITFKEINSSQDYNQNKKFNGVIGVEEYKKITPTPIYCTFDGELTQGAEYVNGEYTYRYMQEYKLAYHDTIGAYTPLGNMDSDGWSVTLTDKDSTNPVTSEVCTYINDKPVISASAMFFQSFTTSIDLSNFNTSNIINMEGMFWGSKVTTLDLSNFDTSNVTNMSDMFANSQVTTLDLSSFDTSKVIKMNSGSCQDGGGMFGNAKVKSLDLSAFDTSNVTNMSCMFQSSEAISIDLSSFDTSKVTDMSVLFFNNTNLKTVYVSNKFTTNVVTSSGGMFTGCTNLVGGNGTVYDSTKVDKTYARIDTASTPGYFTAK